MDLADLEAGRLGPLLLFNFAAHRVCYQHVTQARGPLALRNARDCPLLQLIRCVARAYVTVLHQVDPVRISQASICL